MNKIPHSPLTLTQTALATALIAVLANLTIPTHPVPFSLLTFALGLVATLLRPKQALAAGCLYLLLGAIGLPVFANGAAGFHVLLSPTAGYLWGIPLYLLISSLLTPKNASMVQLFSANLLGVTLLFTCGWLGLILISGLSPLAAFQAGVLPFVFFDLIKIGVITLISPSLRSMIL